MEALNCVKVIARGRVADFAAVVRPAACVLATVGRLPRVFPGWRPATLVLALRVLEQPNRGAGLPEFHHAFADFSLQLGFERV